MSTVERWTGREARRLRAALRLTVRDFAAHLGIAPRTIAKWEARGTGIVPLPQMQAILDTALSRAPDDARTRFWSPAEHQPSDREARHIGPATLGQLHGSTCGDGAERRAVAPATATPHTPHGRTGTTTSPDNDEVDRRDVLRLVGVAGALAATPAALGDSSASGAVAIALPEDWLRVAGRRTNRRIGSSDIEAVREMTSLLSQVDQRRGGGHGRTAVMEYLNSEVADQLNGVFSTEETRRDMLSAAGELAYLVGWMAFDDSDHALAEHYFTAAVRLAKEANDPPLMGHVLRAMAHQALDLDLPTQAHDLATASIEGDRYARASPRERSLLGVIHARSMAAKGEAREASATLLQAEDDLSAADTRVPEPSRVFFFSEASLAHETACALRDLGDLPGAVEKFRRSIELRDPTKFARTHAVTLGYLGNVKARQGEMGEACAVWSTSLNAMQGVRSGRARRVVAEMRATLLSLSEEGNRSVRDLEYMAATYLADSSPA